MGSFNWKTTCLLCALFAATACGDGSSSSGSGDGDGDNDNGDGDSAADWLADDFAAPESANYERNLDCPGAVGPSDGSGAARGACCHRGMPNSARAIEYDAREAAGELEADELFTFAFRLNNSTTFNLPETLGAAPLPTLQATSRDQMAGTLLFEFGMPRVDGERASGPGYTKIGAGFYNCDDGRFSFYGDQAAPTTGEGYPKADDPARIQPATLSTTIDASKTGVEGTAIAFEDRPRGYNYSPTFDGTVDEYELDYELLTRDFDILALSTEAEEIDCQGERDGDIWVDHPTGLYEAYLAMAPNNTGPGNGVKVLQESSVCTLMAFGILSAPEDFETLDCETTRRCEPGSADCRWKSLPDSLCPVTEEEIDIFRCHVGDEDSEPQYDGDAVNCSPDATTEASDDSSGQCCDPLGASETLPACNAWRTLNSFVAASADITEEPSQEMFRSCQ